MVHVNGPGAPFWGRASTKIGDVKMDRHDQELLDKQTFRSKKRDARVRPGKNSACSGNLQMLIQAIHNRQHINLRKKECPDRGTFVGAKALMRHLSGTKKGCQCLKPISCCADFCDSHHI